MADYPNSKNQEKLKTQQGAVEKIRKDVKTKPEILFGARGSIRHDDNEKADPHQDLNQQMEHKRRRKKWLGDKCRGQIQKK